jgi:hypothetical protein
MTSLRRSTAPVDASLGSGNGSGNPASGPDGVTCPAVVEDEAALDAAVSAPAAWTKRRGRAP